jgi:YesN/AraC family two-component response regulator
VYRILVIDDEDIITDSLARMLESLTRFDLDVYKAYSAAEALERLEKTDINIVITDIQMPGKTGLELLKDIRASWPGCQVIFLTGYGEFEYAVQAVKYHAARYILKTEGYEPLIEAVADSIEAVKQEERNAAILEKAREQAKAPPGDTRPQTGGRRGHGNSLSERILSYMRENPGADLSLYALSEKFFLNPSYLSRLFKEETGKNITDTVLDLRLEEACRLLKETERKINQIAVMVGYESPAYFSNVFKRRFGVSPQEYRDR